MISQGLRSSYRSLPAVIFLVTVLLVVKTQSEVYRSLQWTPENPIFRLNLSGCADGVLRMNVLPSSKLHVVCPTSVTVLDTVQSPKPKHELYENLWIIYDKESFEKCNANATNAEPSQKANRLLMECDKPLELKYFTIVFQEFSAVSGGLQFPPGIEYYFLATSNGNKESLRATSGGNCNDTQKGVSMKFKVYVCNDKNDSQCTQANTQLGKLYCERPQLLADALRVSTTPGPSTAELSESSTKTTSRAELSKPSTKASSAMFIQATSVVPRDNTSVPGCIPEIGAVVQKDSSAPPTGRDTWMPIAVFLLCFLVALILGFCVYRKFSRKDLVQGKKDRGKNVPLVLV